MKTQFFRCLPEIADMIDGQIETSRNLELGEERTLTKKPLTYWGNDLRIGELKPENMTERRLILPHEVPFLHPFDLDFGFLYFESGVIDDREMVNSRHYEIFRLRTYRGVNLQDDSFLPACSVKLFASAEDHSKEVDFFRKNHKKIPLGWVLYEDIERNLPNDYFLKVN